MTKSKSPRLRTVDKVVPPYPLNQFPTDFGYKVGKEVIYILATRSNPDIAGKEWERIFANCIGATWKPSNVGLDDIVLENCAWSAKSVFNVKPESVLRVRLISGRNSPKYSFGETSFDQEPNYIGEQVLSIWNERVSALRKIYKHLRTVVLIKSKDLTKLGIFEFETIRFDPDLYEWNWNENDNLEGLEKATNIHRFTWQPHGSQFTIIEDVAEDCLLVSVQMPSRMDKESVLKVINFDVSWISVSKRNIVK